MSPFAKCLLGAAFAALSFLWMSGCEAVASTVIIGQRVDQVPAHYTGTWQLEEEIVHLRAGEDGALHAAAVEWTGEAFEMTQLSAILSTLDGRRYLHVPVETPDDLEENQPDDAGQMADDAAAAADAKPAWHMLLIEEPEPDVIVLYLSDAKVFRTAVQDGRVSGVVERDESGDPMLTTLNDKASLDAFVRSMPSEMLFPRDEPGVVRRVKPVKPNDPDRTDDQPEQPQPDPS